MAPPKRHYTPTLTTSEQDVPIASSDPIVEAPAPRRSSRIRRSSAALASSSSRQRSITPASRRSPPRAPTVVQTTPARPPRSIKGKGLHKRQLSISEDPNMSPFRNPAYVRPELEIPSDAPEARFRPQSPLQSPLPQTPPAPRRRLPRQPLAQLPHASPSPSPQPPQPPQSPVQPHVPTAQEAVEEILDVELPFTTELGTVYAYPPPDPNDNGWLDELLGNIERNHYVKQTLVEVKAAVAGRLYDWSMRELELTDLLHSYDKMLQDIGRRRGKDFEDFLRDEAGLLMVPGLLEEGTVHRRQPSPPPQPPQPDERLFDPPAAPSRPSVRRQEPVEHESEHESEHELVPTDPADPRSSPALSSPSNRASFLAKKRRIEAASSAESGLFIHFQVNKRRRTTPGPVFRYSPLPPSSPPLPSTPTSGSPRPEPARLSPVAEEAMDAQAEARVGVLSSDPNWLPNDSNAENIDPNGHAVDHVVDVDADAGAEREEWPVTPSGQCAEVSEQGPPTSIVRARLEVILPSFYPPRSSDLDIPMAWPPRSDEVAGEEDESESEAGEDAGAEAEAGTSYGQSVSAALARAKGKGKGKGKGKAAADAKAEEKIPYFYVNPHRAAAIEYWLKDRPKSPAEPRPFRKYTKEEEDRIRFPAVRLGRVPLSP